jgi:hypothetical protein
VGARPGSGPGPPARRPGSSPRRHRGREPAPGLPDWDEPRRLRTARAVYAHFGQTLVDILWMAASPRSGCSPSSWRRGARTWTARARRGGAWST